MQFHIVKLLFAVIDSVEILVAATHHGMFAFTNKQNSMHNATGRIIDVVISDYVKKHFSKTMH